MLGLTEDVTLQTFNKTSVVFDLHISNLKIIKEFKSSLPSNMYNFVNTFIKILTLSDVSIKIRSFGKFGSGTLMNIVRKWANENEIKVEYNVELVLDYYVVHKKKYKHFWQKNYTSL